MAFVPFVDIVSIAMLLGVMFVLDLIGFATHIGSLYLAAGVLGMLSDAYIFVSQGVIYQSVYNPATSQFVNETVDPNLIVAIVAVVTIVSFLFIFYEKQR